MRSIRKLFIVGVLITGMYGLCAAQNLELMPPDTERLSALGEEQDLFSTGTFHFRSASTKEEIVEFYRTMFINSGYEEVDPAPIGATPPEKFAYFFRTPGRIIMLNFFLHPPKEGFTDYYITAHLVEPDQTSDAPQR
ncbi:MAG: hypothetical protein GF333_08040 [Candidatus Omnitrophica bacterium]|nr:hypothetical protein [Candidatus Omnitrophota bacterium]